MYKSRGCDTPALSSVADLFDRNRPFFREQQESLNLVKTRVETRPQSKSGVSLDLAWVNGSDTRPFLECIQKRRRGENSRGVKVTDEVKIHKYCTTRYIFVYDLFSFVLLSLILFRDFARIENFNDKKESEKNFKLKIFCLEIKLNFFVSFYSKAIYILSQCTYDFILFIET